MDTTQQKIAKLYEATSAKIRSIESSTGKEAPSALYRKLFQLEDSLKAFGGGWR